MKRSTLAVRQVSRLAVLCLVGGVLAAGAVFPFAAGTGRAAMAVSDGVNSVSTVLVNGPLPQTSTVTDKDGNPIARFFDPNQNRQVLTAEQISPAMKAAIMAVEDRRFYEHQGVDWQGTLRAVIANSASGDVVQGASTLTQQYVKNYFLYVAAKSETERLKATEQTPARKLKEAQIAVELERSLSKEEILARYLNIVSFGNGAAGVAAAARTYFNTTADQLTVSQAALLAGMVRSATATDPVRNPEAALERRNVVLGQMREQQMISDTDLALALGQPLGVVTPLVTQPAGCIGAGDAGFFCMYVAEYLQQAGLAAEELNRGGYTITTTLDRNVLDKMRASLLAEVPADRPNVANNMAVVAPGADRHRVLAMGSSRTFGLDRAKEETSYGLPFAPVPHGAGSVYKIFTAATAMEKGLGIDYELVVPPSGYASPIYLDERKRPLPVQNAGDYPERLSLTDALALSPNTAFVKLEEFTGVPDVVDMAVRLGLRSLATIPFVGPDGARTDRSIAEVTKAQKQASFTLGVTPTSVLELANVGATLASAGVWCPPSPIEKIIDPAGNPVPITETPCAQAVAPGLANTLLTGLSKDDTAGTAARAAGQVGWSRPMGGKTGTTQEHKSAAFIGIVPQMSGAVITFDNSNAPKPLCDGAGAPFPCRAGNIFGGKTPAETWFGTMTPLLADQPVLPLPPTDPRFVRGGVELDVPDVVGQDVDDARAILREAGWPATTRAADEDDDDDDDDDDGGRVVGQSPAGTALPGESIELSVG